MSPEQNIVQKNDKPNTYTTHTFQIHTLKHHLF
jgi:hypothetical protein